MKNGFMKTEERLRVAIAKAYDRWYSAHEKYGMYAPETRSAWADYEGICNRLNRLKERERQKEELAQYIAEQQALAAQ